MAPTKEKMRVSLASFDLAKGLAMISIIVGHSLFHYDLEQLPFLMSLAMTIPSMGFLMPMFFVISGYSFKEKPIAKMLKITLKQLIAPYCLVMVVYVLLYPITFFFAYHEWEYGIYEDFLYFGAFLLGIPKPGKKLFGYSLYHCSAVWFLLALFTASNLLNLILKVKHKSRAGTTIAQTILVGVCVAVGYELLIRDVNYYCIPQGLMSTAPLYIGYLIKKSKFFEQTRHAIWPYAILIPAAIAYIVWGQMDLAQGVLNYGLVTYAGACCTGVLCAIASAYIGQFEIKALDWIRRIGTYTYWILCIHVVENGCMHWWAFVDAIGNQQVAFFLEITMKTVIITAFCFALKNIARRKYRRKKVELQHCVNAAKSNAIKIEGLDRRESECSNDYNK